MIDAAVSSSIAVTLAFSPFSVELPHASMAGPAAGDAGAPAPAPAQEAKPEESWDEPADSGTPPTGAPPGGDAASGDPPPPTASSTELPAPTLAPPPALTAPPPQRKGTGLIVAASITGTLGWTFALTRMAFVKQCGDQLESTSDVETGTQAAWTCFARAGVANILLLPVVWGFNIATWGLAPAAGATRGKYDGTQAAFFGKPDKKAGGFIGAGAGLLAVGVIGRITAAALFARPFRHLDPNNFDFDAFGREYRIRMFGVQLSSATIALGAGLLAYGIAYKANRGKWEHYRKNPGAPQPRAQLRIVPSFDLDPRTGMASSGMMMSGRF
jgi:hypothetical protein